MIMKSGRSAPPSGVHMGNRLTQHAVSVDVSGIPANSARRRPMAAAAAIGAAVLAACGPAVSPPGSSPGPATSASSTTPATSPPPSAPGLSAGFGVLSMTFVSDDRGFALGSVPCASGRCAALLGTTDGGRRWHRLTAPTRALGGVYSTCQHGRPCVQQVRFATPAIGYAFSPALLMTTDGGQRWRLLARTGVSSLEAADGTVVRVAAQYEGCAGAPYRVESAPVGTDSWQALPAPPIEKICPPVLYRQGSRLVLAGYGNPAGGVRATAQIDLSANAGTAWSTGPDQCGGKDGYASTVALAPPDVLVLLCQHQMPNKSGGYNPAWVRISTDGGATFGPDRPLPASAAPSGTLTRYQLAAASAARFLVVETGTSGSRLLTSQSAGRTWSAKLRFPGNAPVLLVGFEDPRTARVAQADSVWTTRDGGHAWRRDQFIAG